jgi:hypothetical protein
MSEIGRRRGFAILGVALLVEAGLGLLPSSAQAGPDADGNLLVLAVLTHALLPAALGIFMIASSRKEAFVSIAVRASFVTIVGIVVSGVVPQLERLDSLRGSFAFQPASLLLMSLGAPILWASALVRKDHPGDPALLKFGRISAGLIQLGFVFQCALRLRTWAMMGRSGGISDPASTAGVLLALASLLDIAGDLLLLWASIEGVRTSTDEDTVRRRAERTHRLLMWNMILVPLTSLLVSLSTYFQDPTVSILGTGLWWIALYPTILVATTFALARWYQLQFAASMSPIDRSGGVQSTGEPS